MTIETAIVAQGLAVTPDDYLDLREPAWAIYEQVAGSVIYTGPRGRLPSVITVSHPVLVDLIRLRRGW